MMIFVNAFFSANPKPREAMEKFTLVIAPFAPHLAEELWEKLGHASSLAYEPFPVFDPAKAREDVIEMVVQVNGKLRAKLSVPQELPESQFDEMAKRELTVQKFLSGKTIVKTLFVRNKLINYVVK